MKNQLWLSKNQPSVLLVLILFSALIWALQWFFPPESYQQIHHMPGLLVQHTRGFDLPEYINIALGYPLYLFSLFLLYKINSRFQIIPQANYLVSWVYLFITCTDYRFLHFSPDLIAVNLLLLGLYVFLQSQHTRRSYKIMFYTGFLLLSAALLNAIALVFIIFILFSLPVIKAPDWRETANFLLGIATLAAITSGVLYLTDNFELLHHMPGWKAVFPGAGIPDYKVLLQDFILGLFLITAVFFLITRFGFLKINVRRYFRVLVILTVFMLVLYFGSGMMIMFRYYLAIPVSFILTHFLVNTKLRFLAGSFLLFLALMMMVSETLAIINNLSAFNG